MSSSACGTAAPRSTARHISAAYRDDDAWGRHVTAYLREGFDQDEQMLYFADSTSPERVVRVLTDHGLPAAKALREGRLVVRTAQQTYLSTRAFDPDAMIRNWHEAVDGAAAGGYTGVRAIGEMSWYGRPVAGADRLLEYELRIHREVFEVLPTLSALCLYDRRLLADQDVAVLLAAHPVQMHDQGERPRAPLVASPLPEGPGLRLAGEVGWDSRRTVDGVAEALSRLRGRGAELDLSGVAHVDVAGASRIAVAAGSLDERLVVRGAPPSLRRILELFPELNATLEVAPE